MEAEGCDEADEENEVEIGYDQLPAPARKYLEVRYKGFEFEEAEIEDGNEYEVEFEYQNKCWEAEFDQNGAFVEIEPCD